MTERPTSKFGYPPQYSGIAIEGLGDVTVSSAESGQVLVYNSNTKDWENANVTDSGGSSQFYKNPMTAGNTNNQAWDIPVASGTIGKLASVRVRWEFPFNTDSALLRFWRYRKENGNFTYTQITDSVTYDSSDDWSTWHDMDPANFRAVSQDLNPDTDSIALTVVYTEGASPTVQAFQINFTVLPNNNPTEPLLLGNPVSAWPPV